MSNLFGRKGGNRVGGEIVQQRPQKGYQKTTFNTAPPEAKQEPAILRMCTRSGQRPSIVFKFGRKLAVGQFIFCPNCSQEIQTVFDGGYTFTNHLISDDKEGVEMGAGN